MSIAITGATGQLGRLVIERLVARGLGSDVIALARTPGKAGDLGVTVREADYARPETLGAAFAGVDTLVLISSSEVGQRLPQHRNVIAAAREAGVKHLVYTSLLHADTSLLSLAEEHRGTEAELARSGLPHTILRNGWYTENHLGTLGGTLASGAILGSAGQGGFSSATRADFADAVVAVVTGSGHEGRTYELAGDSAYTLSELAAEISRQSGTAVTYTDLPEAQYATTLAGFGLPEPLAAAIASWDVAAAKGSLFDDGRQLSKLIGRPTTPLATSVAEALAAVRAPRS